jgi:hypothetical protein
VNEVEIMSLSELDEFLSTFFACLMSAISFSLFHYNRFVAIRHSCVYIVRTLILLLFKVSAHF